MRVIAFIAIMIIMFAMGKGERSGMFLIGIFLFEIIATIVFKRYLSKLK